MKRRTKGTFLIYFVLFAFLAGIVELLGRYWFISIPLFFVIVFLIISSIIAWNKKEEKFRRSKYGSIDLDSFDVLGFERFCALLLKDCGYSTRVTQASGDHGIDVIASKEGYTYNIQCKHYSKNVGNKAIQEAYAGRAFYGGNYAVVMTNRYFISKLLLMQIN